MKFDDILSTIGDFGPFQIRTFLLFSLAAIPCAMHMLAQVFLAGHLDHWCDVPELDSFNCTDWGIGSADVDLCLEAKKNVSIPCVDSSCMQYAKCERYQNISASPMYVDNGTEVLSCDAGWVYDRSEFKSSIVSEVSMFNSLINCKVKYQ